MPRAQESNNEDCPTVGWWRCCFESSIDTWMSNPEGRRRPFVTAFSVDQTYPELLALHWVGSGAMVVFYDWHGHSVDIDIERQHEGFKVQFLSIPSVVSCSCNGAFSNP